MLDPGVGFAKTREQNLTIINRLEEIGLTLDLPVDEREEGTIATSVIGAMKGCEFFRVHDVQKNVRALRMTDAIRREN